jgi:DUF4097 and DUF4098 domain-containing protein YvlB
MRKWITGAVLFVAAMTGSAPARAIDQIYDKTVPLGTGGALVLQNVNGSVEVHAWDRQEVQIHAVKSARRSVADLDLVTIEVKAVAGKVEVLTRYPSDEGVDVSVQYKIQVPRRVMLENITTVNGNVRVTDVDGGGQLRTVNGDVDVYDCAGGFNARTTNGSIHEELRSLDAKSLALETMNGSILMALPPQAGAEIDAQSLNGVIRTEEPVLLNGAFGHGSFRGKMGPGGSPLRIRTVNGAIQITVWRSTI